MRLSLLVLTYRRVPELLALLDSLARDGAPASCETVVGLNDEPAANAALARLLAERHPWVRTLPLRRCGRGEARNRLAAAAAGELLYFLDDDTLAPPGFIARVRASFLRFPDAAAIGGPNVGPPGARAFPRAADFLLRSPLGAGPMRVRHLRDGDARRAPGWWFTLSNLGVRRDAFRRGLRFPPRAASAEETLFLHELERAGQHAVHDPALFVFHRRRPGWVGFFRQVYSCGVGRAQITRAAPSSLLPATLAPVAALAAATVLARAHPAAALAGAGLYLAAGAFEAARMAWSERDPAALLLPALFPFAHAAYACGLAAGAFAVPASDAAIEPRLSWDARPADG
ncbi:MAG: glycosyltransferase [Elusimicrobiota bacterium]|nr:glycosyltransferase [Elusimicrobiota bacterium]